MPDRRKSLGGFTLLELLVVLLLVALSVGLVAPAVVRTLDAAQQRGYAADLEAALVGLPMEAFRAGAPLRVDEPVLRQRLPDLPSTWRLNLEPVLEFGPTGMLRSEAQVSLRSPAGELRRWRVAALTGAVSRVETSR